MFTHLKSGEWRVLGAFASSSKGLVFRIRIFYHVPCLFIVPTNYVYRFLKSDKLPIVTILPVDCFPLLGWQEER